MVYKPKFTSMPFRFAQGIGEDNVYYTLSSGSSSGSTSVSVCGSTLSPAPSVDIETTNNFTGAGDGLYTVTRITLTGKTTGTAASIFGSTGSNYITPCTLTINVCGTSKTWNNCRVVSVSDNRNDNYWVRYADYTIVLENYEGASSSGTGGSSGSSGTGHLLSTSETWTYEPVEDSFGSRYTYSSTNSTGGTNLGPVNPGSSSGSWSTSTRTRVSHRVSARAINIASPSSAWQDAKDWVCGKVGGSSGSSGSSNKYNHYISINYDVEEGSYEATEQWIESSASYIEDMTLEVSTDTSSVTTVRVQGSIQGLASGTNPSCTTGISGGNLYGAARAAYSSTNFYSLASSLISSSSGSSGISLNASPVSTTEGHDIAKGVISYSYEYNTRPFFLGITNALSENVSITDSNSADVFSEVFVIGRSAGPVIQDLGTKTSAKRDVSIEFTVPASGSLTGGAPEKNKVNNIVSTLHPTGINSSAVAKVSSDTETWSPTEGRFSRNISWTYQFCSSGGS